VASSLVVAIFLTESRSFVSISEWKRGEDDIFQAAGGGGLLVREDSPLPSFTLHQQIKRGLSRDRSGEYGGILALLHPDVDALLSRRRPLDEIEKCIGFPPFPSFLFRRTNEISLN